MSSEQQETSTPRFNYVGDDAEMVQESDGEFVKFADYDQSLAEKQEEIEKLRSALAGLMAPGAQGSDRPCWCLLPSNSYKTGRHSTACDAARSAWLREGK